MKTDKTYKVTLYGNNGKIQILNKVHTIESSETGCNIWGFTENNIYYYLPVKADKLDKVEINLNES